MRSSLSEASGRCERSPLPSVVQLPAIAATAEKKPTLVSVNNYRPIPDRRTCVIDNRGSRSNGSSGSRHENPHLSQSAIQPAEPVREKVARERDTSPPPSPRWQPRQQIRQPSSSSRRRVARICHRHNSCGGRYGWSSIGLTVAKTRVCCSDWPGVLVQREFRDNHHDH